jgi:hypothetical protein
MADVNREIDPEPPDREMRWGAQTEQPGRQDQEAQPSDDEEFEDETDDDEDDEDVDEETADQDEPEI